MLISDSSGNLEEYIPRHETRPEMNGRMWEYRSMSVRGDCWAIYARGEEPEQNRFICMVKWEWLASELCREQAERVAEQN